MIRLRFHGRGGQGMKTASRIVGAAAVLDGFIAQDSPIYGAERRGAPMSAFVRIARDAILERGSIPIPDIVVAADDTLLDDPTVRPLAGLPPTGVLLIATSHPADDVRDQTAHRGRTVACDFVALALEEVGSAAGLSTGLAAAACALLGISEDAVDRALREELAAIGLSPAAIAANLRLAERARSGVMPVALGRNAVSSTGADVAVVEIAYAPPEIGTPNVTSEPNTPLRKTGNWRVFRPVVDLGKCSQCWICFVHCPDGAISLDDEENPHVDYAVCKGCLICAEECPTNAIAPVREGRERVSAGVGS